MDDIGRAVHAAVKDAGQVLTDDPERKELHPAEEGNDGGEKRETLDTAEEEIDV
jgi:hypothetical protein